MRQDKPAKGRVIGTKVDQLRRLPVGCTDPENGSNGPDLHFIAAGDCVTKSTSGTTDLVF